VSRTGRVFRGRINPVPGGRGRKEGEGGGQIRGEMVKNKKNLESVLEKNGSSLKGRGGKGGKIGLLRNLENTHV